MISLNSQMAPVTMTGQMDLRDIEHADKTVAVIPLLKNEIRQRPEARGPRNKVSLQLPISHV
jgi:hypothetical protein